MPPQPRRRSSPVILGLAAGVGLATGHVLLRFEPAARALVAAQQRQATLEQSIAAAPVLVDLGPLEDEVEALRVERDALLASNAERAARVAPPGEVPALEHRVAALARDAGLRLESQEVAPGGATGATAAPGTSAAPASAAGALAPAAEDSPRGRLLTLSGGFPALWRFIASLEGLPRRVVLRDLQVTRQDDDDDAAGAARRLARRAPRAPLRIQVTVVP